MKYLKSIFVVVLFIGSMSALGEVSNQNVTPQLSSIHCLYGIVSDAFIMGELRFITIDVTPYVPRESIMIFG